MAEERIDDRMAARALNRSARGLTGQGYQVADYDAAGRAIPTTAARTRARVTCAAGCHPLVRAATGLGQRFLVLVPIVPDSGVGATGTVAVARSTEPLDHRIAMLWALIGSASAAGLLVAAGIGAALARWASCPITNLGEAARQLASQAASGT